MLFRSAICRAAAVVQVGVSTADDETNARVDWIAVSHAAGIDMCFDMIDGDKGNIEGECDGFCGGQAYQQ